MTVEELLKNLQTVTPDHWGNDTGQEEKRQMAGTFGHQVGFLVASFPRSEQRAAFAQALLKHFCDNCGDLLTDPRGCACLCDD